MYDLRLRRLRQITTAILSRRYLEIKQKRRLLSWQTRTIAQFISATVPVDEGKENPLMAHASKVTLDQTELEEMEEMQEEREAAAIIEPEKGSYERFMLTFGRGGEAA